MPYHLLLVGDPTQIPYNFQYPLDTLYSVGQIHFDTFDAYAAYANSVVAAETEVPKRQRRVTLFSPVNDDDPVTETSERDLARPLEACIRHSSADGATLGLANWDVTLQSAQQALRSICSRYWTGLHSSH